MKDNILVDFGSHSLKVYQYIRESDCLNLVDTLTWRAIEVSSSMEVVDVFLNKVRNQFPVSLYEIHGIGTEAIRRSQSLEEDVRNLCSKYQISFEILSQEREADLIKSAFDGYSVENIVNVGGGSIQIVSRHESKARLYSFGISDLVKKFHLDAEEPMDRQCEEAFSFLKESLSSMKGSFVYSGGELTYLRRCEVPTMDGKCFSSSFKNLVSRFSKMKMSEILKMSPYDPQWMRGAVASNTIVEVLLEKSNEDYFYASDLNIAHGLCKSYLMRN